MQNIPPKETADQDTHTPDVVGKKRHMSKRVLAVIAAVLIIVAVGAVYAYNAVTQPGNDNQAIQEATPNPDEGRVHYNEAERESRLRELQRQSADRFESDDEREQYYGELTYLYAFEGQCGKYEETVDEYAAAASIDASWYIGVAECYEANDGSEQQVLDAVAKAEKRLAQVDSDEDRQYMESQIAYLRGLYE